jgi:predicted GTPase
VINKTDSVTREVVVALRAAIAEVNAAATIVEARSPITVENETQLSGLKVLVVEDGPTLTHGEMPFGAGVVAARRAGAVLVDPRPWAEGSIAEVYERHPHIGALLPAMGYSGTQRAELAATINDSDADAVLIATPIDLRKVIELNKPAYRATYELGDASHPTLAEALRERLGV